MRAGWVFLLVTAALSRPRAHDVLAGFLQHRVEVRVGARHIDVTLQVTFFEDGSEHEREHMDRNADQRISAGERQEYVQAMTASWEQGVRLRVAGATVPLLTLFPPELDLLGQENVGRGHHRLTLHFFARTPPGLTQGADVTVEDRLWPAVRALVELQAEGRDGARVEALPPADSIQPAARPGEARNFTARIRVPPPRAAPPPAASSAPAHPP
jgi:hypothetical protein